jgi:alkylation response protein AidB-like acyl-CoA dehydrogenase
MTDPTVSAESRLVSPLGSGSSGERWHSLSLGENGSDADFRARVREFAGRFDRDEVAGWEASGHLPREAVAALGRSGLLRERWDEGRAGLRRGVIIAEELAAVSSGLGIAFGLHSEVFISTLERHGRGAAQEELLQAALDGEVIGCLADTERRGGSAITDTETRAERIGDQWHIRGQKRYISNAGRATHALLLCRTGEQSPMHLGSFILPLDDPGVQVRFFDKAGTRSCDLTQLDIDVALGPEAVIGRPNAGLLYTQHALQLERICVSALLIAGARIAMRLAAAHMRTRRVAGARLWDLQALRHRVADVVSDLWMAEAFLHAVVAAAAGGRDVGREAAALKLRCANIAYHAADESIQIFGGRGYTTNFPLERWWRDLRLGRIASGTDEIMRELAVMGFDRPDPQFDTWLDELNAADEPFEEIY